MHTSPLSWSRLSRATKYLTVAAFVVPVIAIAGTIAVSITTVDNSGVVALHTSIDIGGDGFPVISHYDNTSANLKVTKCGNAACSSGNTSTAVDTAGSVGHYTSLEVDSNGFPVISYYDSSNTNLKVAKCANAGCTSATTLTTVDATGSMGEYTSLALGTDGFPVISYYDTTNTALKVAKCFNSGCTVATTLTIVDNAASLGTYSSIAIGNDGFPVISYYDLTNTALKVAKCANSGCTTGTTVTTLDSVGTVGRSSSIAVDGNGLPVISYYDDSNADFKVAKCGNVSCTTATITAVDSTGVTGDYTSIAIGADGFPVISYYDGTNTALRVAKCSNSGCTASTTLSTVDNGGFDGMYSTIAIGVGSDNFPVIAYANQTAYHLKVAKCYDFACAGDTETESPTLTAPATSTSITPPSMAISYSLPESPLSNSITLNFNDGGSNNITLTMDDDQTVSFTLNLLDIIASPEVASSTSNVIPDGTYTVTLSYVDALGNAAATDTSTSVVIATPVVASSSSSSSSESPSIGGGRPATPEMIKEASKRFLARITAAPSSAASTQEIHGAAPAFSDVSTTAWFFSAVDALRGQGIISGYKDAQGNSTGLFGPADNVTHGEFAKMIIGLTKRVPSSMQADKHWAEPYVREARRLEWTVYMNEALNLEAKATRGEIIHTILQSYNVARKDIVQIPFSDLEMTHPYAQDILTATALGIVSGDDGQKTFRPNEPVNRAETAKILVKVSSLF
ncbi:S-layer homology domain-containing protein [Candidatus Peribacteria bacterium]|nr:MAG: S-layer homology domain-containing protein [Candidatus Peribacteria bacterium]